MTQNILDITGIHCPMTFVKVKIALSKLSQGEELLVILREGEPMQNVPGAVESEGHKILDIKRINNENFSILIKKK